MKLQLGLHTLASFVVMNSEQIIETIKEIIEKMGFGPEFDAVEMHQGAASRFEIRMRGEARMLIGEHGNNLASLEHLLKKIVRKRYNEEAKFTLDINDYRMKRLEDLKQEIKSAAKDVRLYHKSVPLRSMSSFERRIVHLLLAEYPDITTESTGEEPYRKVIIKPFP